MLEKRVESAERGTDFALNHTWHQTSSPYSQIMYFLIHLVEAYSVSNMLDSLTVTGERYSEAFLPLILNRITTDISGILAADQKGREGGRRRERKRRKEEKKGSKIPFRLYWFLARNGRRDRGGAGDGR